MLVSTVVATIFLSKTTQGRYIYGVGGNEEAARLAGINVSRVKMFVYIMSGVLAAVFSIILLSGWYQRTHRPVSVSSCQ